MAADTSDLLFGSVEKGEYTGKVTDSNQKKTPSNKLGKDEFLQLLVAEMRYQDPLEPTSNTEYIAQLATFSQVEQLQNLSNTYTSTQAFSMVGQTVTVSSENETTGKITTTEGVVDFVSIKDGKAYLSIDGNLYSAEDISKVKSSNYAYEEGKPSVSKASWSYNGNSPSNVSVAVNLGSGVAKATKAALVIGEDYAIEGDAITISDGKLTVDKDALAGLKNGTYAVTVVFDDERSTNITDQITLSVYNSKAEEEDDTPPEEDKDDNQEQS